MKKFLLMWLLNFPLLLWGMDHLLSQKYYDKKAAQWYERVKNLDSAEIRYIREHLSLLSYYLEGNLSHIIVAGIVSASFNSGEAFGSDEDKAIINAYKLTDDAVRLVAPLELEDVAEACNNRLLHLFSDDEIDELYQKYGVSMLEECRAQLPSSSSH